MGYKAKRRKECEKQLERSAEDQVALNAKLAKIDAEFRDAMQAIAARVLTTDAEKHKAAMDSEFAELWRNMRISIEIWHMDSKAPPMETTEILLSIAAEMISTAFDTIKPHTSLHVRTHAFGQTVDSIVARLVARELIGAPQRKSMLVRPDGTPL